MLTHAQYSVTLLYKSDEKFENRTCDTFTNKEEKVVGCHSRISSANPRIYLRINASGTDFYKIYIFRFFPRDIEKMDPPQNIKASIESGSLKIKWNQPHVLSITNNNSACFQYELKLNDSKNVQIQTIHERTSYNLSIIDAMRTYLLKLRGKKSDICYTNNIWSDWSTIVVLKPEGRNKLNSLVIALIVLGIPSVLLAVLLIFRCQRVLEKLFPPIPSPIIKNKNVLEKDTFFKTDAPKYIEEITIVVEDSSEDDRL
uniref:Interleukin-5 receptor subunit alpha-like n=1 Tax=Lepisosteus oculatus TaxID=7918 RepID=W5M3M8_LEPOC|nr:PREDICTED: interleukin-5 receptor subunit alpha-like [Lepisosteus oculatus]